jgi:hypothetical protein
VKCGDGVKSGGAQTALMLNFREGKFQHYNGPNAKPFMSNINGQWIRFKVVFRGSQKKIDVYYGDSLQNK